MANMNKREILQLTGAGEKTLYRWMERHPHLAAPDPDSMKGHPFPRPRDRAGRNMLWDREAVHQWWKANKDLVGRHTREKPSLRLPAREIAEILWTLERSDEPDVTRLDYAERQGDRALIKSIEYDGDQGILHFRTVSDAAYFLLKRTGRRSSSNEAAP